MKKNIALIFGGKSSEHEVSIRSGKNVAAALDKSKFEFTLIGISKEGSWYKFKDMSVFDQIVALNDNKLPTGAEPVALVSFKGQPTIISLENPSQKYKVDCAFPILHGSFGEDGSIQGLFRMANIPFVGCDILASSVGMDKEVMKRLLIEAQIPSAKYLLLTPQQKHSYKEITDKLGTPFFIKPANSGSSVGVHKIKSEHEFAEKLADAFLYDHKVLAEEMMVGREIEISVMGHNRAPKASVAGEVTPTHEFYSYEAKYLDENGALLKIPAELDSSVLKNMQQIAIKTYQVLGCDGLTRVDFFLKKNNEAFINEVNTIPGFTKISMYPKMWEASGISYSQLITDLINLAFEKFADQQKLLTNFDLTK